MRPRLGRPDPEIWLTVVAGFALTFGQVAAIIRWFPTVLPPAAALVAMAAAGFGTFMMMLFAAGVALAYRAPGAAERWARAGERLQARGMGVQRALTLACLLLAAAPFLLVRLVGGAGLLLLPAIVAAFWWRMSRAHAARLAAADAAAALPGPVGRRGT